MRIHAFVLAALVIGPTMAAAQSGQSTARALAMGRSMTASARGYEAIVWNPALLGTRNRPKFSINIAQVGLSTRSNVLSPSELWRYYTSDSLSQQDKTDILDKVRATSDSTFGVGALADVMAISVTVGNFGISLTGTAGDADAAVGDDAIELILFGNTARRAPGERYVGAGSRGAGLSVATLAASWGQGIAVPVGHLAVGATAKLRRGLLAGGGNSLGSYVQNAPNFEARAGYQVVYFDPDVSLNNGSGFGLDLGAAYDFVSGIRIAAAIENVFSTMSWKDEKLRYKQEEYQLLQSADGSSYADSTISDVDVAYNPADATQKALRDSLLGVHPFATKLRLGGQMTVGPVLLAGDAVFKLSDGIVPGAGQRLSVGAELPIAVMRFRGGLASDFDGGFAASAGIGFKAGPVLVDFAGAITPGGDRKGLTIGMGIAVMP
ncbi:MAG: DUF5723 family protein [Gemmatimonadota bacterium]|nr:DUF5723 family protein [Gemmatimonadota bacterium]MDH5195631.1 DUF5723 family protein [Gemmatimonadota bacterium]